MVLSELKVLFHKEDLDGAIALIDTVAEKDQLEAQIYNARIQDRKGNFSVALELAEEAIKLAKKRNNKSLEISARVAKTGALLKTTNLDEGLEYALVTKKMLDDISDNIKNKIKDWISLLSLFIGVYYDYKGELHLALESYTISLKLEEEQGNVLSIANCMNNLGEIYREKGELDLALEYYNKSLDHFTHAENRLSMALSFHNIGIVHNQKGDITSALKYMKRSLVLQQGSEHYHIKTETLFHLVLIALETDDIDAANSYYNRIVQIQNKDESIFVKVHSDLAIAIILKNSKRMKLRAKSQQILEEIVDDEIVVHEITIYALLHLCELLLNELKIYGDQAILEEIEEYSNRLLKISDDQSSSLLQVEAYIIQSRIALLNLDLDRASILLTRAQRISNVKGLNKLAIKISSDHDILLSSIDKWNKLIENKASLVERLELADFEDVMWRLVRNKIELPEISHEEPALFLILDNSGNYRYTKNFTHNSKLKEGLIGAFVSAINTFSQSAFSTSEPVERIKHHEYTIIIKTIRSYLFCYVFKGQSYFAVQKIEKMERLIKQKDHLWQIIEKDSFKVIPENEPSISEFINDIIFSKDDESL